MLRHRLEAERLGRADDALPVEGQRLERCRLAARRQDDRGSLQVGRALFRSLYGHLSRSEKSSLSADERDAVLFEESGDPIRQIFDDVFLAAQHLAEIQTDLAGAD